MRARGTWVLMFFLFGAVIVAFALNHAFRDLFLWLQVSNSPVLGESFRLSSLIAVSVSALLAVFFGFFYRPSRQYIDQCFVEFSKVNFPEWKDTKGATFTVVIVSVVASAILGVFDAVFAWWTNNNLFIW